FRLYAGRKRRQLLAAVRMMHKERAAITATPKPVSVGDVAATTTIAWETGGDLDSQVYMSEQKMYGGYYPVDSREAIAHLEGLRAKGAQYLLFPATAFWWLDHYQKFRDHLEARYRVLARDESTCIIFDLRESATSPTIL